MGISTLKKLRAYAREKVAFAWLVNATERILEILRLQGGQWVIVATHGGDAIVRAQPFAAVAIDLLDLWGETRAPTSRPSPRKKKSAPKARQVRWSPGR